MSEILWRTVKFSKFLLLIISVFQVMFSKFVTFVEPITYFSCINTMPCELLVCEENSEKVFISEKSKKLQQIDV